MGEEQRRGSCGGGVRGKVSGRGRKRGKKREKNVKNFAGTSRGRMGAPSHFNGLERGVMRE